MSNVQQPKSASTVFLDQPPSCLEFCPQAPDHFVIGTYLLSETKNAHDEIQQTKTGSVQLWKLDPDTSSLSLVQKVSLPYAVFDLHFHPRDTDKFAIASSTGCISLFSVDRATPSIHQLWTKSVHEDPSVPALFFAWTPPKWLSSEKADGFAVTFSDGRTSVYGTTKDIMEPDSITEWGTFDARQMIEVWFVALLAMSTSTDTESATQSIPYMFTGNDFGSLHTRRFEVQDGDAHQDTQEQPAVNLLLEHDDRARHHTAGVTAILPLPVPSVDDAPIILTGSYDESLRVYHATRRGEVLAEQGLGGGVWRLQLLSCQELETNHTMLVLASCMHAGTRLVRVTRVQQQDGPEDWTIEILAEFTEHESMNYASDTWKGTASSDVLCVSSSFYDRRVCVWRASV
ncbi:hypothetical protein N7539_007769 [Penicillium diatomitis]|uniref:Uncharacterized protein n=1 Tax=Penicillium diatomitis TaxID=2819901 RepID=A0A9X0BNQ8_9EURO|nr:uncharacterized protein N7539_007769 [Penicillium diatomitis]KAJ5475482.1 hypothetical protein N7539_007769 [Penicillium diatomitis]